MFKKWFIWVVLSLLIINVSCKKKTTAHKNTEPTAAFIFEPESGTTETIFTFDASSSTDEEDDTDDLQVRWDWENDGTWDSEYRTLKTITKVFTDPRTYYVVLEVLDTEGLTGISIDTLTVVLANSAPVASFTVDPESGTTSTTFSFDASGSSDEEDSADNLQVRWDWENDGTWNTQYSTTKTATHQFTTEGTYTVNLEVKDSEDKTTTTTKEVVVDANTAPSADFNVNPISGTINTVFSFDASGSSDEEDSADDLQVRWDWENDGTWDTQYSTTKTATHQYSAIGTPTIMLEVKDTEGLTNTVTHAIIVENTAPVASFTVDPESGTTSTTFSFDASGSSDEEDSADILQVRWDWENDGTWDTQYSTTKTATHTYTSEGTYTVKLEVMDTETWVNATTQDINVQGQGNVIQFSDSNFEALIRTTLGKPTGDITDADMLNITTLNGGGWSISDFTGIAYCTNLQSLTLYSNQISDISELEGLINLDFLDLSYNQVVNISALLGNLGLSTGDIIYLTGNPLSSTSQSYITDLETRGVTVYFNTGNAVTFSDSNFETLIRNTLSKPTGDITEEDMETITLLNGNGWVISDISGIEYCTNLVTLNLSNNNIIDISSLENLINLDWVDLSYNQIVNIGGVLDNLGLSTGDILYLTGNPLSSGSESFIPIIEARGVTVYYGTSSSSVVTFSDSNFEALIRTTLSKPTGDITTTDMETITSLIGDGWAISDITGIEYCTNLETLNLADNSIVDLSELSNLANLLWVDLSDNLVVNISALLGNLGLGSGDTLYLTGNPLSSTSESYIPDLEARGVTVYWSGGTAVSFSDSNFEALIRNALSKPTGDITISDMGTLTSLIGDGWAISDITGIEYGTNIQTLNLDTNTIIDISELEELLDLDFVDLSDNQITDINALVQNSGISSGDTVYLNGNPLSATSTNTYIPQLEARGVTVYH